MGGAGKQLAITASALIDRGHDVSIYTYIGQSLEHTIDERIQYIAEQSATKNKISEYYKTPWNIRRIVKNNKPDVVISWRANAGCMTVLGCVGLKVKVVYSERSDPYMETNTMLKIATKICEYSDGGVFQTEKARDYYKRLINKSIVLPNPVVMNQNVDILPIPKRNNNIVWIGRIKEPQKRLDVLLEAFQRIHTSMPNVKLSIYGDGPDMENTKALAVKFGLQDFVVFHGAINNAIDTIKNYSLMILSSDYEGIPNVVIEAFMAGVPVVSTDCSPGGARVLIEDGENGFIVPIRDDAGLADKACVLLKNPQKAEKFVKKSLERLKIFDSEKIFNQWDSYLRNIVKNLR